MIAIAMLITSVPLTGLIVSAGLDYRFLSLTPDRDRAELGEEFTVTVSLNRSVDNAGVSFTYDPAVAEFVGLDPFGYGVVYNEDAVQAGKTIASVCDDSGVGGNLFSVTFKAAKQGQARFDFVLSECSVMSEDDDADDGDCRIVTSGCTVGIGADPAGCVLTFDANGGDSAPEALTGARDYVIPDAVPATEEDVSFLGWSKYKGDDLPEYVPGNKISLKSDMTLYAVWGSIKEIKVSLEPDRNEILIGEEVHITLSAEDSVSYGDFSVLYDETKVEFICWECPDPDLSFDIVDEEDIPGRVCLDFDSVVSEEGEDETGVSGTLFILTFKAVGSGKAEFSCASGKESKCEVAILEKNDGNYTLSFDAGAGINAPGTMTGAAEYVIPDDVPEYFDADFIGWSVDKFDNNGQYLPGDKICLECDTVLYAVWNVKSASLVSDYETVAVGEEFDITVSVSQSVSAGDFSVCFDDTKVEFLDWKTTDPDISFWAIEEKENKQGIVNLNFDSAYSQIGEDETVVSGDLFVLRFIAKAPGNAAISFTEDVSVSITNVCAVTVVESIDECYKLSFDANGGKNVPAEMTDARQYIIPESAAEKDGYIFFGWAESADAKNPDYMPGDRLRLHADKTVYAVWVTEEDCAVVYLTPDRSEAAVGDEIVITLSLADAVNYITHGKFPVVYNSEKLQFAGSKMLITDTPEYAEAISCKVGPGPGGSVVCSFCSVLHEPDADISGDEEDEESEFLKSYKISGDICSLTFKVLSPGKLVFGFDYSGLSIYADGDILVTEYPVAPVGCTVSVPCSHQSVEKIEAAAPTCAENGNNEYYKCTVCGEFFTDKECSTETSAEEQTIVELGHDWNDGETVSSAACTENGEIKFTCKRCGKTKSEDIPAAGHTPEKIEAVAPACTENGNNEYYKCAVCGKYFTDEACETETSVKEQTVAKTGHSWDEGEITKPETCAENGAKTFTCKVCGDTKEETLVANGEHTWDDGTVVREATFTEKGTKHFVCTVCGETKDEETPVLVLGNVNDDEEIRSDDARDVLRYAAGLEELTPEQLKAADVNKDGKVDADDARHILRAAADLEDPSEW